VRLGIDDIVTVIKQQRLRWYGRVLIDDENDWLKNKCMDYEVEDARPRDRPKKTWSEVTEKDCRLSDPTNIQLETVSIAEPLQNRKHAPVMLSTLGSKEKREGG